MLSYSQKANILAKSGCDLPRYPSRRLPIQERHLLRGARAPKEERDADEEQEAAVDRWNQEVETLYVAYVAARAARSLRESEARRQLDDLRQANLGSSHTRRGS